ncbi:MAG: MFS transporter [Alphaproteobacteria bacterium]|jgi:FSR family fosmidomycin resistance protein-like MFS transporter
MSETDTEVSRAEHKQSVRILALISTGHALSNFYILCLPALIPFLKVEFAVSYTFLGLLLSTRSITTGFFQIPVGFMVDRIGGKIVLVTGLFILSISVALLAVIPSFWYAMPLMVTFGIGIASMRPANYTIIIASMPSSWIGRAFGINMFAGHAGRVVAPPLLVTSALLWGWRVAVVIAGVLGIIVTFGLMTQWKNVRDDSIGKKLPSGLGVFQEIRSLASGSLFIFFVFFIFNALGTHGIHSFIVAALAELHNTPLTVASGALTVYLVGSAIGVLAGGFIVDKTPRHEFLAVTVLISSGLLLILLGTLTLPLFGIIILMSCIGLFQGALRPARDMLMRAVIPRESFGKAIGMVATGAAFGGASAPVIFGWILDSGNPSWLFYVLAGCLAILVVTVLIPKKAISVPTVP